jgi:type IV fimbrial biogenesis protein FimT
MTTLARQIRLQVPTNKRKRQRHRTSGVTLIELICTMSIVAIVSAIAIPEFGHLRRKVARQIVVNDFLHSLHLARNRAIILNQVVSICPSRDGAVCENNNGNWQDGWIVFQNTDRDQPAQRDANETVIYQHSGWIGGDISSNRVSFSFRPTEQADVNGTVVFCDLHGSPSDARAIIISHVGRPRVSARDANNLALQCP